MNSLKLVQDEIAGTLRLVDADRLVELVEAFADRTRRWFVSGQGRSRLVASMAAMRLMHVGFDVHLTGEVTATSIGEGDCLLMLSASGETPYRCIWPGAPPTSAHESWPSPPVRTVRWPRSPTSWSPYRPRAADSSADHCSNKHHWFCSTR